MTSSRITPIDDAVGTVRPPRAYLLTGGAGSGKTECGLRFAEAGLRAGDRVAMLVHGTAGELSAQATHLGIDLESAVTDGRLLLLRYRGDFARRVAHDGSTDAALDDLRRTVLEHRPGRLVIDSVAPLLDDGTASAIPASSIAELLQLSRSTALLTYPSELATSYDRRLEPLLHAAAGVLRLVSGEDGSRHIDVVSLRVPRAELPPPLDGMLSRAPITGLQPNEALAGGGSLLLLRVTDAPSDDLLAALLLQHRVTVRTAGDDLSAVAFDALVIEADHATLEAARAIIRASQSSGRAKPIAVATRFTLRSLDRARLLRDGADEVLAGDMGMPELLQRLAGALRRGHLARPPLAVHEDETLTHRALALPGELLDREHFTRALRARTAHDDTVPFTLLRLTTDPGDPAELHALAELVLTSMRVGTGDLAAFVDDAVAVYLHGAGRRDVAAFLDRLRARRPAAASAVRFASACYPAESAAVRQLVEPLEVR
jgi:KaiC/GvpD/RAD55 family RecA-like ATPase/DNA-binding response OmpR family regulator